MIRIYTLMIDTYLCVTKINLFVGVWINAISTFNKGQVVTM